jgi:DNA-binding Lrp family transcriptional regulator
MKHNIENLSDNEKKFLTALLEDGSKKDSEIADETGMSKSTANRIRRKFEDEDIIEDYIPIVNLEGAGIEIYSLIQFQVQDNPSLESIVEDPSVIFLGETGDYEQEIVIYAGFSDYQSYEKFVEDLRDQEFKVENFSSKIISSENIHKEDYTHLIQSLIQESLR